MQAIVIERFGDPSVLQQTEFGEVAGRVLLIMD